MLCTSAGPGIHSTPLSLGDIQIKDANHHWNCTKYTPVPSLCSLSGTTIRKTSAARSMDFATTLPKWLGIPYLRSRSKLSGCSLLCSWMQKRAYCLQIHNRKLCPCSPFGQDNISPTIAYSTSHIYFVSISFNSITNASWTATELSHAHCTSITASPDLPCNICKLYRRVMSILGHPAQSISLIQVGQIKLFQNLVTISFFNWI